MRPFQAVADLLDGRFAVVSIDPTKRIDDGCECIILSIHATECEARQRMEADAA